MRNRNGETPRDVAYAIAITELAALARELPNSHRDEYTPAFERQVRVFMARMANRMLRKSGLHGNEIDISKIV